LAHILTNRRAGNFAKTLGVSALLFGLEVLALNALIEDGRTDDRGLALAIAWGTPVVQVIASVLTEKIGR